MMHFCFGTLKDLISNKLSTDRCWVLHVSVDGFWSNTSKVVSEHIYKWDALCCSDKRHLCWFCVVWMDLHGLSWLPRSAFCRKKAGSSQRSRTGGPGWVIDSAGALCLCLKLKETWAMLLTCLGPPSPKFRCELRRWGIEVPLEQLKVAVHHPLLCCAVPSSGHSRIIPSVNSHTPKASAALLLPSSWVILGKLGLGLLGPCLPKSELISFFLVLFKSGPFK